MRAGIPRCEQALRLRARQDREALEILMARVCDDLKPGGTIYRFVGHLFILANVNCAKIVQTGGKTPAMAAISLRINSCAAISRISRDTFVDGPLPSDRRAGRW